MVVCFALNPSPFSSAGVFLWTDPNSRGKEPIFPKQMLMHFKGEVELEDPFAQETLESLMPRTFQSLLDEHPHQDFDSLLSHLALKKTEKGTQEAEAILSCTSKLDIAEIHSIAFPFNKDKSERCDYTEEMAQEPVISKENIPLDGNFVNPRIRREGSGRHSTRQPFSINSRSFGSKLNVQKDPRNLENVDEFFAAAERQETAEALLRKMKGEKSPVTFSSQQLFKSRVRRQGTGRRTVSKNFDVKLPCKYTQLDGELLEVEVEEFPSTFTGSAGQDCDSLMETAHESRNEECLAEAVNNDFQNLRNMRAESNSQNITQANNQLKIPLSETEETVNMPPKNFFSFENSAQSVLHRLLKDYMKEDGENKNQAPFSTSGAGMLGSGKCTKVTENDVQYILSQTESSNVVHKHSVHADEVSRFGMHDSGKPYPNDLQHDMQNALLHSQTESSDTIHKQSLCVDEVKTNMQPYQILRNSILSESDRTPIEDFCQKAKETCNPLTSPTPPSRLSAAFKLRRKHAIIGEDKSTDACLPTIQNRDEEMANDYTSSHSQPSRKSTLPKKGQLFSKFSSTFKSQRKQENAVEGNSGDGCSPRTHNRDEELATYDTNSPAHVLRKSSLLKEGESCGGRRLTFDSPSNSTKKDECNNDEGLNGVDGINLSNHSECYDKNEKVEMGRTDIVIQSIFLSNSQKAAEMESTEMYNCNALASGQPIEKSPITLHNKKRKKMKRQSKNNANKGGCDDHEEDKITSKEIASLGRKNKRSDYHRRQSLAGAGTLWKSGVRRSTRIRSRPLEYWRGERFLYGRIHNTLTTVIGIKYSSPDPAIEKKKSPSFKVKSYVGDQYSHMVDYAALY